MSRTYFIESTREAATALLCEVCETYFTGENAEPHFNQTGHVVTWLTEAVA